MQKMQPLTQSNSDALNSLRFLLKNPLWQIVQDYFKTTRQFENGLEFAQICLGIMNYKDGEIPAEDKTNWTIKLISLRLEMLDRLNNWEDYIALFESCKDDKVLVTRYARTPGAEERFGKFLVSEDNNFSYINFLYEHEHRYGIVKRKLERKNKGKSVEHLKRPQAETLTENEYAERLDIIYDRLAQYISERENYT